MLRTYARLQTDVCLHLMHLENPFRIRLGETKFLVDDHTDTVKVKEMEEKISEEANSFKLLRYPFLFGMLIMCETGFRHVVLFS